MKAICICLPEQPDAIERARAHFADKAPSLDVEFLWGINAPIAGLATTHVYELDHPGSGYRMGAKATGCWLSHYMAWNVMTRLPDDRFLVLEVDAKLDDDFEVRFAAALVDAPGNLTSCTSATVASRDTRRRMSPVTSTRPSACSARTRTWCDVGACHFSCGRCGRYGRRSTSSCSSRRSSPSDVRSRAAHRRPIPHRPSAVKPYRDSVGDLWAWRTWRHRGGYRGGWFRVHRGGTPTDLNPPVSQGGRSNATARPASPIDGAHARRVTRRAASRPRFARSES